MNSPLSQQSYVTKSQRIAAAQVSLAAINLALVPVVVHFFAMDTNPFLFNTVHLATNAVALYIFLRFSAKRHFGQSTVLGVIRMVQDLPTRGSQIRKTDDIRSLVNLFIIAPNDIPRKRTFRFVPPVLVIVCAQPIVWVLVARFQFAFYAWSTRFIDVAVTATVFELWPVVMVIVLSIFGTVEARKRSISRNTLVLMCGAFVGLAFVILGQSNTSSESIRSFFSVGGVGLILALAAAICSALSPAAGILLGDRLIARFRSLHSHPSRPTKPFEPDEQSSSLHPKSTSTHSKLQAGQALWFAVIVHMVAAALSVPIHLALGLATRSDLPLLTLRSLGGGVLMGGVVIFLASLLLRSANLRTDDLGINAIFYVAPIISLGLLSLIGISLTRPDLFWMGAIFIFCLNVLIHLSPEEERDYQRFALTKPRGTRMGFTSFILALWAFGAVVYLRDEFVPSRWMEWHSGEYWTLVALSATVFALIFGFRVARLSSRLGSEDDLFFHIFRRCEYMVKVGICDRRLLDALLELDSSQPGTHLRAYELTRQSIGQGILHLETILSSGDTSENTENITRADFYDLLEKLDRLAHSKQQGRDFSELISIGTFAGITVALGLFARPADVMSDQGQWTGFLTEMFVAVFVSVVAFLAFNLLDMRREREIPLIVHVPKRFGEYGLFFRHKRDTRVSQRISVVIVLVVLLMYTILFYSKWL